MSAVRATIYQPQYLPRLHYINRILDTDVFVVLDSAQFTRTLKHRTAKGRTVRHKSYQAHAPVKLPKGEHLLTVPVRHLGERTAIDEAVLDPDADWGRTHLATLGMAYSRAAGSDRLLPELEHLLRAKYTDLAHLNVTTTLWALRVLLDLPLGLDELTVEAVNDHLAADDRVRLGRIVSDRALAATRPEGRQQGNEWNAAICHELGADENHVGGTAAGNYLDREWFTAQGITPVLQDWRCPEYPQQFTDKVGFLANLSVVDLLLNVAPADALDVVAPR